MGAMLNKGIHFVEGSFIEQESIRSRAVSRPFLCWASMRSGAAAQA